MATTTTAIGRVTNCDYSIRHPRARELSRDCIWVTVSGWEGQSCLCAGCRDYLRRVGRTITNVDQDYPESMMV